MDLDPKVSNLLCRLLLSGRLLRRCVRAYCRGRRLKEMHTHQNSELLSLATMVYRERIIKAGSTQPLLQDLQRQSPGQSGISHRLPLSLSLYGSMYVRVRAHACVVHKRHVGQPECLLRELQSFRLRHSYSRSTFLLLVLKKM